MNRQPHPARRSERAFFVPPNGYHAVSLSGGKDSTAMLLLMIERGMPIDIVLHADTGMEFPEMQTHLEKLDAHLYKKRGIHITRLRHHRTFEELMFDEPKIKPSSIRNRRALGVPTRGNGWPGVRVRWCTGQLKTHLLNKAVNQLKKERQALHYIGIAADEAHRCKAELYPLVDWGITEAAALQICYNRGFDFGGLYMILIQNLSKVYGKRTIIKSISMQFEEGRIYGLIGVNGCGKTTLMRCICGFSQPTTGYVVVNGCLVGNKAALRRNPALRTMQNKPYQTMADFAPSTGVIIESPGFLPKESGLKNLLLLANMSGKADEASAKTAMMTLGLDPEDQKPVGKYSLGQRQRLGFAQAIMENPNVLILDEPFNAMDKDSMELVHELLQQYKAEGKIIILASHSAEDIQKACDIVYQMENGELKIASQSI